MQRVRNLALADRVTDAKLSWWQTLLPVSATVGRRVAHLDLDGRTASCHQHLTMTNALTLLPLLAAGARLRIAAVDPESTDDVAAAWLAKHGAEVWAWRGMSAAEVTAGRQWLVEEPSEALGDMGGELVVATVEQGRTVAGALEATTSGLHRLADVALPFPVFDWNGIALKDRLHNRHHVGLTAWPAFSRLTGLGVHGRSVLVVGFGPVGRGVALVARALGAVVFVAELDPVRALEAQHHGCRDVPLDVGLATCGIVVTATGMEGVLGPAELRRLGDGTILVNVGHSNREIDVAWLDKHPCDRVQPCIDRYSVDGSKVFLLNRGSLVNLAPGQGASVDEFFDPFAAVILTGLTWILEGGAAESPPGLQPYPHHLELEIAELARQSRR